MAFSTEADEHIPAIKIEHEGDESYDNMWQKSRSIWKYIGAHYADEFDYFLLGGDDMYFIIENLKAYLSSDIIVSEKVKVKVSIVGDVFSLQIELFLIVGAQDVYWTNKH